MLLKACHKANEQNLRSKANGKTKCDRIQNEQYGKKSYVGSNQIQYVPKGFRTRFGMNNLLATIPMIAGLLEVTGSAVAVKPRKLKAISYQENVKSMVI